MMLDISAGVDWVECQYTSITVSALYIGFLIKECSCGFVVHAVSIKE